MFGVMKKLHKILLRGKWKYRSTFLSMAAVFPFKKCLNITKSHCKFNEELADITVAILHLKLLPWMATFNCSLYFLIAMSEVSLCGAVGFHFCTGLFILLMLWHLIQDSYKKIDSPLFQICFSLWTCLTTYILRTKMRSILAMLRCIDQLS